MEFFVVWIRGDIAEVSPKRKWKYFSKNDFSWSPSTVGKNTHYYIPLFLSCVRNWTNSALLLGEIVIEPRKARFSLLWYSQTQIKPKPLLHRGSFVLLRRDLFCLKSLTRQEWTDGLNEGLWGALSVSISGRGNGISFPFSSIHPSICRQASLL